MNFFQKYWSYFFRIIIEETSSTYNPKLIIAIQEGKFVLNTQNANYSYGSLHRVFQQAFRKIDIKNQLVDSVLLLGCGTGSVPSIIYKELQLSPKMDAVEIDEKVINLGNKYFNLNQFDKLNIHINDAVKYIETTDKKYDLVVIDLFEGISVPEAFLKATFFHKINKVLNENGQILFNYVAYNHETKETSNSILEMLQEIYKEKVTMYRIEGINKVFHMMK